MSPFHILSTRLCGPAELLAVATAHQALALAVTDVTGAWNVPSLPTVITDLIIPLCIVLNITLLIVLETPFTVYVCPSA